MRARELWRYAKTLEEQKGRRRYFLLILHADVQRMHRRFKQSMFFS